MPTAATTHLDAPGAPDKPEPTDLKAQARALTRMRRLRYYPVRISDGDDRGSATPLKAGEPDTSCPQQLEFGSRLSLERVP